MAIDRKEVARLYTQEGCTFREIARRLGANAKHVSKLAREEGIARRPAMRVDGPHANALYSRWSDMRKRARSEGAAISPEWSRFPPFQRWALRKGFRRDLVLARADPGEAWSPANCRWWPRERAYSVARVAPTRRAPRLTAFGETKTLAQWQRDPRSKVSPETLRHRLVDGHSLEAALIASSRTLRGIAKLPRPLYTPKPRQQPRRERDWAAIEQRWREHPVPLTELARSLGLSRQYVLNRLRHLLPEWRGMQAPLLPRRQRSLLRLIWNRCVRASRSAPTRGGAGRRVSGLELHEEWRTFEGFAEWALASGYGPGMEIHRKDPALGSTPANCTWIPAAIASHKPLFAVRKQRPRSRIEAFGEVRTLTEWSHDPRCQVSITALAKRLRAGWHPERALTLPPARHGGRSPILLLTAFGQTKSIKDWARDPRCRVTEGGLRSRIDAGLDPETALTVPRYELDPFGLGPDDHPRTPPPKPGKGPGRPGRAPSASRWVMPEA